MGRKEKENRVKQQREHQKTKNEMVDVGSNVSVITVDVNSLNISTKKQILAQRIKNPDQL